MENIRDHRDVTEDLKRYIKTYGQLKRTNECHQQEMDTLDLNIQRTENLFKIINEQNVAASEQDTITLESDRLESKQKMVKGMSDEISQLEAELKASEERCADILKAINNDQKLHEDKKQEIENENKIEKDKLVKEVGSLMKQLHDKDAANINLQVCIASSETNFAKVHNVIEKLSDTCKSLEFSISEMETKISKHKLTSEEDLTHLDREQRFKIIDLKGKGHQLQIELNNVNKKENN